MTKDIVINHERLEHTYPSWFYLMIDNMSRVTPLSTTLIK